MHIGKKTERFMGYLEQLSIKRKKSKVLSHYEILLTLYFDIGGRLPGNSKKLFHKSDYPGDSIAEEKYLNELLHKRLMYLVSIEKINESMLITMLINRVNTLLEQLFAMLLSYQIENKPTLYKHYLRVTPEDIKNTKEINRWWMGVMTKNLNKKNPPKVKDTQKDLYYQCHWKKEYSFLTCEDKNV